MWNSAESLPWMEGTLQRCSEQRSQVECGPVQITELFTKVIFFFKDLISYMTSLSNPQLSFGERLSFLMIRMIFRWRPSGFSGAGLHLQTLWKNAPGLFQTAQTRNKCQEDWKRERRALCDFSDRCKNYDAVQIHAFHLLGDIKDRWGEGIQKNCAGHPDVAQSFLCYFLWVIAWTFLLWPVLHQNNVMYLWCNIFNQWHQKKMFQE